MTTDLLTVTNLTKRYADYQLANVSFSLPAGYIMGFIGPNGAGKTTTIKAILDMIKPLRQHFGTWSKHATSPRSDSRSTWDCFRWRGLS